MVYDEKDERFSTSSPLFGCDYAVIQEGTVNDNDILSIKS